MPSPRLDTFRLRREDDAHIALEFGSAAGAAEVGSAGAPVDPSRAFIVTHRIVMPELAAWRLVDGLSRALDRPVAPPAAAPAPAPALGPVAPSKQARVGATLLDLGVDPALRQRGTTPLNLPPDPMAETADWLMAAVADMSPNHYQERSMRLAPRSLQSNRFLLSIGSRQMPPDALERAWAIARHLGMPQALRPDVESAFAHADHLHFGYEGEPGRVMCKLYFERTVTGLDAAHAKKTGEPALQYQAFKWNVATGEHVVSEYRWHAGLSNSGIRERMAAVCGDAPQAVHDMALSVLDLAASRLPPERLLYLEVTEQGQPRRSFDMNLYDAKLQVRDLQAVLFSMRDHFEIRPGQFQAVYDQIKSKPMGHLAGGIHRNGQPFFNIYFGGTRALY